MSACVIMPDYYGHLNYHGWLWSPTSATIQYNLLVLQDMSWNSECEFSLVFRRYLQYQKFCHHLPILVEVYVRVSPHGPVIREILFHVLLIFFTRGKVMSHRANKLHMPYLTIWIYCSWPISGKSINCFENPMNSWRHWNLCPNAFSE